RARSHVHRSLFNFFFSSRRRHTRSKRDWSSDVCSSDLGCTKTPFEMMELSCEALELTRSVVGKLNASAASDLGCAALSLKAAIQGAWLNVLINIGGIQDQAFAEEYRKNGQALLERALPLADAIYQEVLESL